MTKYSDKNCYKCQSLYQPSSGRQKYCNGCLTFTCENCKEKYKTRPAEMKITRFCSRSCQNKTIGLGVDRKIQMTQEIKNKISKSKKGVKIWGGKRENMTWTYGSKNSKWKGENVSYRSIHNWVVRSLGKAKTCFLCGSVGGKKGCHWANLSQKYHRDTSDYINLCPSCHGLYDSGKIERGGFYV